ncbi:MAG: tetratricopeptide repeat protein [Calditrichaeota bacterium]|nr:MAG: tetratricopeptide repeat protein [Calditrichota bacterium]
MRARHLLLAPILVLIAFCAPLKGNPTRLPPDLTAALLKGKRLLYNLDVAGAEAQMQHVVQAYPRYPHGRVYLAYITFIKYAMNMPNDSLARVLLTDIDEAIQATKRFYQQTGDEVEYRFNLGLCYGIKGFYYGVERNYFKTYWFGKKGKGNLEKVVALDSTYEDAYLGLGIYHYFTALLPGIVRFMASILGFHGDRQKGIQEMHRTAERGLLFKEEAWFTYATTRYFLEGAYQEGLTIFKWLLDRYPGNAALRLMIGYHYRRNGHILQARRYFEAVPDSIGRALPDIFNWKTYNLGTIYFMENRFQQAEALFSKMDRSRLARSPYLQAATNFYLGLLADLKFNRRQALAYYQKIPKNNQTEFWYYLSRMHVDYPMDSLTYRWVVADNLLSVRNYEAARRLGLRLWSDLLHRKTVPNPNLKPLVVDLIARSLLYQGRLKEARHEFERILAEAKKMPDKIRRSWIYIHYARCLRALGEYELARRYLDRAHEADDQYTRLIIARERHVLDKLKKQSKQG